MTADEWPDLPPTESHEQQRARLAWWQERRRVEELLEKKRRGFDLAAHEEAILAYSQWGTAAGCPATGFFLGSR